MHPALIDILNSTWLLHSDNNDAYAAIIISLLNGEKFSDTDFSLARERHRPYLVSNAISISSKDRKGINTPTQDRVTGIVPIRGEIMKYDQECGPRGSMSIAHDIKSLEANPQVGSILLIIDSPGGQTSGVDLLSDVIKNCTKPVIAFVQGTLASAAYWIASGSDRIIASSSLDRIGSIGTMLTVADLSAHFEAEGVKFHEVYATKSPDKNQDYRNILSGKYDSVRKDTLDVINAKFHDTIIANRENIDPCALTGKMYFAPQAIEVGLIDEINTLEYAFSLCSIHNSDTDTIQTQNNIMKIKFTAAMTAIASFFGLAESSEEHEVTPEMLVQVSDRLSELQSLVDASEVTINNLSGDLSARDETIATLTADLTTANSATAEVTRQFDAFKAEDAAAAIVARTGKDKNLDENAADKYLHNQIADQQA